MTVSAPSARRTAAHPSSEPARMSETEIKPPRENALRRLYRWVVGWADTPYGTPALAAVSFTESSFFPIPPDVLQIALSVAKPRWSYWYAFVSSVASVAGGVAGYFIGLWLWAVVGEFFLTWVPGFRSHFPEIVKQYHQHDFWLILGAAFTPIPYKVFTVAAGVARVDLMTLIFASVLGRSGRFFLVATAIFFFGERVKSLLENYFELITLALFGLLILGFVMMKYVI